MSVCLDKGNPNVGLASPGRSIDHVEPGVPFLAPRRSCLNGKRKKKKTANSWYLPFIKKEKKVPLTPKQSSIALSPPEIKNKKVLLEPPENQSGQGAHKKNIYTYIHIACDGNLERLEFLSEGEGIYKIIPTFFMLLHTLILPATTSENAGKTCFAQSITFSSLTN